LVATTIFLLQRGLVPYQFSVAAGQGLKRTDMTSHLRQVFASIGHSPNFTGKGADILAISKNEWWAVECKGSGAGKAQTQRNNFDRAFASVVFYYEEKSPSL